MRFHLSLALVLFLAPLSLRAGEPAYPPPEQVKQAFLKLLDRPRVPLDVKDGPVQEFKSGNRLQHFTFASEKADGAIERVPVLLLTPKGSKGKAPAVIVLHGTGGSMRGMMAYMEELAKRGIIGVAGVVRAVVEMSWVNGGLCRAGRIPARRRTYRHHGGVRS